MPGNSASDSHTLAPSLQPKMLVICARVQWGVARGGLKYELVDSLEPGGSDLPQLSDFPPLLSPSLTAAWEVTTES